MRVGRGWCLLLWVGVACASGKGSSKEDRSERSALVIERSLREARAAMAKSDAETAKSELEEAKAALASEDGRRHPDRSFFADDLKRAEGELAVLEKELARQALERKVGQQRAAVEEALNGLEVAAKALKDPDSVTEDTIEVVGDAQAKVADALVEGTALEAEAPVYAEFVKKTRKRLEPYGPLRERANRILAFKLGPVATYAEAEALLLKAKAEEDRAEQATLAIEAKTKLGVCLERARVMIGETPELAKLRYGAEGKSDSRSGAQLLAGCEKEQVATAKWITKLQQVNKPKRAKAPLPAKKPAQKPSKSSKKR